MIVYVYCEFNVTIVSKTNGSETRAIKREITFNIQRWIDMLSPKITNFQFGLFRSWWFDPEEQAHDFEQNLLWLFRDRLIISEGE
ncbi:MAG: hypothetical protein CBE21_09390 [Proteobacteria bacterium TMED261]|nr:MAG: hypothetical protein CBE21_09390 [Proteobacteria bacterium TMED261]